MGVLATPVLIKVVPPGLFRFLLTSDPPNRLDVSTPVLGLLDSVENFDNLAQGLVLLDQGHHFRFPIVDFLRSLQDFSRPFLRYANDAVLTSHDDVARIHSNARALNSCIIRNTCPSTDRTRWH